MNINPMKMHGRQHMDNPSAARLSFAHYPQSDTSPEARRERHKCSSLRGSATKSRRKAAKIYDCYADFDHKIYVSVGLYDS